MEKLVVLLGPTASGKTAWAAALAKEFFGEIISADSRQVYRDMDIGTAKDKSVPQHLLDIINPDQGMSVAEYKKLAIEKIRDVAARGRMPFLVGGTAQYIYAVVDNWEIPAVPPQALLREELEEKTITELLLLLREKDPRSHASVDKKNKRRVVRALEVTIASGKPFSEQRQKGEPLFETLQIGIDVPRGELHRRIDDRVDAMLNAGLVAECRALAARYGWDAPGMNGIGYRQFRLYTEGKETLDGAIARLKHDTKDVAKRQMTWFRRDRRIHWVIRVEEAVVLIKDFFHSNYANERSGR